MDIQPEETTMTICPDCDSYLVSGHGDGVCSNCHGTGEVEISTNPIETGFENTPGDCEACSGSGTCQTCNGSGQIEE